MTGLPSALDGTGVPVGAADDLEVPRRSTATSYRRPDLRVLPTEGLAPPSTTGMDPTHEHTERDEFVIAARACVEQAIDPAFQERIAVVIGTNVCAICGMSSR